MFLLVSCLADVFDRHAVFFQEFGEIVSLYPVVASRESECWQLPVGNPPPYRCVADAAMLGNKTDRNIFWAPLFKDVLQIGLPVVFLMARSAHSVLTVIVAFELYENGITAVSQNINKRSQ